MCESMCMFVFICMCMHKPLSCGTWPLDCGLGPSAAELGTLV